MGDLPLAPSRAEPASWNVPLSVFLRIGLLSFGGPAGQIALMHRTLVDERKWIEEAHYLRALSFCMLLPGPEAMQLATYVGWTLRGWRGGLLAGTLFVAPGAIIMLALAAVYWRFGSAPLMQAVFVGVKAAVIALVAEALVRVGRRALKRRADFVVAGLAFGLVFFFAVPFPVIVIAAGLFGFFAQPAVASMPAARDTRASWLQSALVAASWLVLWLAPLAVFASKLGTGHILVQVGVFFSKLAVVSFGGAYALLAYMTQAVVETNHWLPVGTMLDGLGLAETTPGPLILVTVFVGFLAAAGTGSETPLLMGLAGGIVTVWVLFAPSFLFVLACAPHIESLLARPRLSGALAAITASVVGVIFNLSLWFGLHVLFESAQTIRFGPIRTIAVDLMSFDWRSGLALAVASLVLFVLRRGVIATLAAGTVVGAALTLLV